MILRIQLETTFRSNSPPPLDANVVTRALLERGYDELDLVGLSMLRARLRDGSLCDVMPLRTEDDATFLWESANSVTRAIAAAPPTFHRTYLWNGTFEITGLVLEDRVRVRAGEYQCAFEPDSGEGVSLSRAEYLALWMNLASTILHGPTGGPP